MAFYPFYAGMTKLIHGNLKTELPQIICVILQFKYNNPINSHKLRKAFLFFLQTKPCLRKTHRHKHSSYIMPVFRRRKNMQPN